MGRRSTREIDQCLMSGLRQHSGTCWFNAALNGLVLGNGSRKILRALVKDYKSKHGIKDIPEDYCPKDIDADFIVHVIHKLLCTRYFQPEHDVPLTTYESLKIEDHGYSYMGFIGMMTALHLHVGQVGYDLLKPQNRAQLSTVLGSNWDYMLFTDTTKSIKSFGKGQTWSLPHVITVGAEEYALDHCVLSFFMPRDREGHVVCGSFCNRVPVIYDSNYDRIVEYDWTTLSYHVPDILESYNYDYESGIQYAYIVYVRKRRIEALENQPKSQLCAGVEDEYRIEEGEHDMLQLLKDNRIVGVLQPKLYPPILALIYEPLQSRVYQLKGATKVVLTSDLHTETLLIKNNEPYIYVLERGFTETLIGKLLDN